MPLIQESVWAILDGVLPGKVWASEAPEGTLGQHITYFRVVAVPSSILNRNEPAITQTRFQVDVYADNYSDAQALAVSVKAAMAGASVKNVCLSEQDLAEEGTRQHRVMLEFTVWS